MLKFDCSEFYTPAHAEQPGSEGHFTRIMPMVFVVV